MTSDHEHDGDVARLHDLLRKALAAGDVPEELLEVTKEELEALDRDRVNKLKAAVIADDEEGVRSLLDTASTSSGNGFNAGLGFNRGKEGEDAGLDEARERLREKRRKKDGDSEDPT